MIKEKSIEVIGHSRNFEYYKNLGYDVVVRKPFLVKIEDIMSGSRINITCICDNCAAENNNVFKDYYIYTDGFKEPYYCKKCKAIKRKETCLLKYGVDNPMKIDLVKRNLKDSLMKKYGVSHYSKTDEYKEKYKTTCFEKYGVNNASKFIETKEKISKIKLLQLNSKERYKHLVNDDFDIISYNGIFFDIIHKICNNTFNINRANLYDRLNAGKSICTICNPILSDTTSCVENELKEFIKTLNIDFISNSYDIINPLSIDIYIPKVNIAIEFNGIYWHSELYKSQNYHVDKTKMCNDKSIYLLHIWEDDWYFRKDIIKSIIINKLGLIDNKIYARKCQIKVVNTEDSNAFLYSNHIQGKSGSDVRIGLYYNNNLVSLMTFGKKRKEFELIRFCNKINTNVLGAASKLFNYFLDSYNYDNIVSYSDISMFSGRLYEKLGFEYIHTTKPNYWWVVDGVRKHRFNYNKKSLIKDGFDANKTEVEIMHGRGYYRIWGCGQKKWIYTKTMS